MAPPERLLAELHGHVRQLIACVLMDGRDLEVLQDVVLSFSEALLQRGVLSSAAYRAFPHGRLPDWGAALLSSAVHNLEAPITIALELAFASWYGSLDAEVCWCGSVGDEAFQWSSVTRISGCMVRCNSHM